KPINEAQYSRIRIDFEPIAAKVIAEAGPVVGRDLVNQVLRGNFQTLMDRAIGFDPTTASFRIVQTDIVQRFQTLSGQLSSSNDSRWAQLRERFDRSGTLDQTIGHLNDWAGAVTQASANRFAAKPVHVLVARGLSVGSDLIVPGRQQLRE